jgi:hypothetical protein
MTARPGWDLGFAIFELAQIDGQPVSLKILLGIRFSAPR